MEVTMANQLIDRRIGALGDMRVLPDEIICDIITALSPRDVARLSCVSSVMYIFCNEEPLWMTLCLNNVSGLFEYKGSWKRTTLQHAEAVNVDDASQIRPLHFDGFYSLFLYRRLYRCYTTLGDFYVDNGNVERKINLSPEEFRNNYDGVKPVLITGLADTWPARNTWTLDQLVLKYGDLPFRISQRSARKMKMKLRDYVSYIKLQRDEDPLYIFDEKFGEAAPCLLKDYTVPDLFQEDLFDVLDPDQRPPFRWLIIGPERSGASWHVDPALTSAWNTLLCGRKRWALYPPGKVPLGVTVHVDEEDGEVNIDTPSSLQWWLDFYPLLPDEDKPIECTQLPGETIFVPSGWWHCVLNLEPTVAVTQNFVNTTNFEFVCLDLAPGYRHKGVCRAGLLATDGASFEEVDRVMASPKSCLSPMDAPRKEKRLRTQHVHHDISETGAASCCSMWRNDLPYEISFLSKFLDEYRDHYNYVWSPSNCIGQREMRGWLWKLWIGRPGLRDLIWKGACIAVNAGKWYECLVQICQFHNLPFPKDEEKLPVGTGSNPVFLVADSVVKIYVEGGLESSLYCLGTELEFYNLLREVKSPLGEHVPDVLASGFVSLDNGSYTLASWDGKGIPDIIADHDSLIDSCKNYSIPFGLWSKKLFEHKTAALPANEPINLIGSKKIMPYIVTKRCKGKLFAEIRDSLSWENALDLASFLGEQLRNLRELPVPQLDPVALENIKHEVGPSDGVNSREVDSNDAAVWGIFLHNLAVRKKNVVTQLKKWGHPIPSCLIDKAVEYLPDDFEKLLPLFAGEACSWIHSDIMDDNLYLEPLANNIVHDPSNNVNGNGNIKNGEGLLWKPSYILDFSDLTIGDPILDLIPIHLDIFRGDPRLLKHLLSGYKLPLMRKNSLHGSADNIIKFERASYRAMCYCILHEDNVLGAVFGIWEELREAKSWEEVEDKVWGILNEYTDCC
ncbi:lysine-specific demethylase JMJ21 isoform X1 [Silene latifolia]|uniref:lysine-specific demethylase JMJ21 isoform X1 n=2 Tax=Silene latifolia TaxID=37657 RepID=UPI003D773C4F